MALSSRLLSLCPRISKTDGNLVAVTAWRMRLLTLGVLYRKVVVDPKRKELTIHRRYAWVFARRYRLRFEAIEAVTYGYQDILPGAELDWARNSFDSFSVGLRLYDSDEWHLFSFLGGGEFTNNGPLPDWMYWDDYVFDSSGTQESDSLNFVNLLSKMLEVTVVPPSQ